MNVIKRILLADDNPGLCSALRLLLEMRLEFELIVEARDMEHVLAQVEDARPDLIILDWELPGRPIHKRIPVLQILAPQLKVIAFSMHPESKESALAEGAEAFIAKNEPPILILDKIQKICQPEEEEEETEESLAEETYPLDQGQDCTAEGGGLTGQTV